MGGLCTILPRRIACGGRAKVVNLSVRPDPAQGARSDGLLFLGVWMTSVVHVIDGLSLGGAQRLLTLLGDIGAKPVILDLSGKRSAFSDQLEAAGARIVRVGATRAIYPHHWWRMLRCLRREQAAVLHLHLTNAVLFGAPLGRILGRKIVVSLHNAQTVRKVKWLSRAKAIVETLVLRHLVDHVIHVGANVEAANRGRLGRVPQTVLPNVIRVAPPAPAYDRAQVRQRLGAASGQFVFVATGRLNPQKDHETLFRAISLIDDAQRSRLRVWVAGDGQLREALAQRLGALGIGQTVAMIGTGTPVEDLLHAADGFVLSSAWEGLPLGLLEAMAAGLPVVATRVGDVPAVLAPDAGVLVPKADPAALAAAMVRLMQDGALRADLVARARLRVAPHLDVEGWVAATQAVYASLVRG